MRLDSKLLIGRRSVLKAAGAGALAASGLSAAATSYVVGVGHSSVPYDATQQALDASGQFPAGVIANRTVILKVNLVVDAVPDSGTTTDPEVTRAVVDRCLLAGASQVVIVEGAANRSSNFSVCGYDFFSTYDPLGRVRLVDLLQDAVAPVAVPAPFAYSQLYLPVTVSDQTAIFISIAKLKTHFHTKATLACKNLVGLAAPAYYEAGGIYPRQDLHQRGIDYSVSDVNMARPIHFAVIDGVIGMEGRGPTEGTPIRTDLVLAGRNAVAVDRVALDVMGFDQTYCPQHLVYLGLRRFGPSSWSQIHTQGYAYSRMNFTKADCAPDVWLKPPTPMEFAAGQSVSMQYAFDRSGAGEASVCTDSEVTPGMKRVCVLLPKGLVTGGRHTLTWNGRDATGAFVAPGTYLLRVCSWNSDSTGFNSPTARVTFLG